MIRLYFVWSRQVFFRLNPSAVSVFEATDKQLDPAIKPDDLPVVAVLDSGVDFPDDLSDLVPVH